MSLIGQTFGQLTVVGFAKREPCQCKTRKSHGNSKWVCRCSCGKIVECWHGNLKAGRTKRCNDCKKKYQIEQRGMPEYREWARIKREGFIHKKWKRFAQFYEDMGQAPKGAALLRKTKAKPHSRLNSFWSFSTEIADSVFKSLTEQ